MGFWVAASKDRIGFYGTRKLLFQNKTPYYRFLLGQTPRYLFGDYHPKVGMFSRSFLALLQCLLRIVVFLGFLALGQKENP